MGLFAKNVAPSNTTAKNAREAEEIRRLQNEVRRLEARIEELTSLAFIDSLVQLPNRRSFESALERLIGQAERYGETSSMIFVDVDGLKSINDRFGHATGDRALVAVAELLGATVRKSDMVARLSGDEFAILLPHADELKAWTLGLRIVETIADSGLNVNGKLVPLSVAVGVGPIHRDDTIETVMSRADQAMYGIKHKGRPKSAQSVKRFR
jgi:diguanylate cyclase (GGDEF)-like protein